MAMSIGGCRFVSCTGRAVSIRRGDAVTDLRNVLREARHGGATILIASPGCWSSPEPSIAMVARYGFQAVIGGFSNIIHNSLINTGILPVSLAPEAIAKVQDTVESDPGIVLTVDVGRGDVRARGELLARFEIDLQAGPRPTEPADDTDSEPDSLAHDGETMARRLLMAQRLLGSASLSGEVRMRWQRRLVAICDAMKAPGADALRCARRLDRLLTELARTGQASLAQAPGSRAQAPASAARARDLGQRGPTSRARRRP
jgi:hypothetical protein